MTKVAADISMSLDGFVTGPDASPSQGLGRGGEALQGWVLNPELSQTDRDLLETGFAATGAVIMGRRTFDVIDGTQGWNDEVGYGYDQDQSQAPPNFVVTHQQPENPRHHSGFTFITEGITAAVDAAKAVAADKEVVFMGGGDVIGQALRLGLVGELRIHLSPVLMGEGTRLFDHIDQQIPLTQTEVIETPHATHLTYQVHR